MGTSEKPARRLAPALPCMMKRPASTLAE